MKTNIRNLNEPIIWHNRDIERSNKNCIYCGRSLRYPERLKSNKEHLIGRQFVPKGSFDDGQGFNFIFRACIECNAIKANLERSISSITLFTSSALRNEPKTREIAKRKANLDYYPDKSGKLIKDSFAERSISLDLSNSIKMNANIKAPPQLVRNDVENLAFKHIQGIFALSFTDPKDFKSNLILLARKYFFYLNYFSHTDWGNDFLIDVAQKTKNWIGISRLVTANGHFKTILKRESKLSDSLIF